MDEIIKARVWTKIDTLEAWNANPLILGPGEFAPVLTSAGGSVFNFKVGTGDRRFSDLPWSLQNPGAAQEANTTTVFPPGVPGLYIPTENGTYNGVAVDLSVGYVQLIWDGTTLVKVEFPIDLTGYATTAQLEKKVNKDDIGIVVFEDGQNIAPYLAIAELTNDEYFEDGFLEASGEVNNTSPSAAAWRTTKDFQPIVPGDYSANFCVQAAAVACIYDAEYNVLQVISDEGSYQGTNVWTLTALEGARFFKTSRPKAVAAQVDYYINSIGHKSAATDKVFMTKGSIVIDTEDFVSSTNLLDMSYVQHNKAIVSDGSITDPYTGGDIIQDHPVGDLAGETVTIDGIVADNLKKLVVRDSDGIILTGVLGLAVMPYTTTFPANAATFDMTLKRPGESVDTYATVRLNRGSESLPYEPHRQTLISEINGVKIHAANSDTSSGGGSFNQSLNTSDDVEFSSVRTGVLEMSSWRVDLPEGAGSPPPEVEIGDAWIDTDNDTIKVRRS